MEWNVDSGHLLSKSFYYNCKFDLSVKMYTYYFYLFPFEFAYTSKTMTTELKHILLQLVGNRSLFNL